MCTHVTLKGKPQFLPQNDKRGPGSGREDKQILSFPTCIAAPASKISRRALLIISPEYDSQPA